MMNSAGDVAREVLDVAPAIVRAIRSEMRRHRTADLSVPQFRMLGYLHRHPGASLSDVSEHLGLTLPTMSKMVDGLLSRKLVTRQPCPADRRRVTLSLTARGRAAWQAARESTQSHLAEQFAALTHGERATIAQAMETLRPIFMRDPQDLRRADAETA